MHGEWFARCHTINKQLQKTESTAVSALILQVKSVLLPNARSRTAWGATLNESHWGPIENRVFPSSDRSIVWLEATVNVTVGGSRELCRIKYLQAPVPAQIPGKGSEAVPRVLYRGYGSSTPADVWLSETGWESVRIPPSVSALRVMIYSPSTADHSLANNVDPQRTLNLGGE